MIDKGLLLIFDDCWWKIGAWPSEHYYHMIFTPRGSKHMHPLMRRKELLEELEQVAGIVGHPAKVALEEIGLEPDCVENDSYSIGFK